MKIIDKIKLIINEKIKEMGIEAEAHVEKSRGSGDFSTNIAMVLAKKIKDNPMNVADSIVKKINNKIFKNIDVAKPGFINMEINPDYLGEFINKINLEKEEYGKEKNGDYINVEYVSANPTGHLHVGHARGAVYGNVLINILKHQGNKVDGEYYINDAGNQINVLGLAVFTRYKQELGVNIEMPENTYNGQDIIDIAKEFIEEYGDKYKNNNYEEVAEVFKVESKLKLLGIIKKHLESLGVLIPIYTSEEKLIKDGIVEKTNEILWKKEALYKKEEATWIKTEIKGDDKDRVIIKSDGIGTYLGSDIANHKVKIERGYKKLINIWGSDHVGQVKRLKVALEYLGYDQNILDIPMIQLVKIFREGKEVKMSKRAGTAYRLIDLVDEIGKDQARWAMLARANDSQYTLDLEELSDDNKDNTLFLVQYAHARANQLINKTNAFKLENIKITTNEKELVFALQEFQSVINYAAKSYKVHLIPSYLIDVARKFNSWYSNNKVIGHENKNSLILLTKAVKQIIGNGLNILGIEPKNEM